MKNKKYIVVGQGLVGSILGYLLEENNIEYKIYSNNINNCTKIAAGLINPIVFKRLNKSFGAEKTIDFAYSFYEKIETLTNEKFIYKKKYARIFASIEEENNWLSKQNIGEYKKHIHSISENNKFKDLHSLKIPFGQGFVKNSGYLNTEKFLNVSKDYFKNNNTLIEQKFNYPDCEKYINEHYEIIFCEGYLVKNNPYFKKLPLNNTKGEIIDIIQNDVKINCIINKGVFVLPIENNLLRIGSTYDWNNNDPSPTEKGKNQLIKKLEVLDKINFNIKTHKAGIRPTVKDRKPLIGTHEKNKKIHIINGMGTRGVALAPYWINEFIDCLKHKKEINSEVNINRFDNLL